MERKDTLTIEDIVKLLKVSRSFIQKQLQTVDLDWELVPKGKLNREIYVCSTDKLMRHIAENSKVCHYDVNIQGFHEKKRPELSEIDMPENLKEEIISGNFKFMNADDVLSLFNLSSRESIYQRVYKHGILILKFKGKSYFWFNE